MNPKNGGNSDTLDNLRSLTQWLLRNWDFCKLENIGWTPYICNDLNGTLVSILGKTKAFWNETKSFQNCVVCGATPTQLAVQDHEVFKNEPIEKLRHGLSNCHLPMKIISWLFKGTEYQDFAYHECYKENRHLADARKEEYQVITLITLFNSKYLSVQTI